MAFGRNGAAVRKLREMAGPRKSEISKMVTNSNNDNLGDNDAFLPSRPPPAPPLPISTSQASGLTSPGPEAHRLSQSEDSTGSTSRARNDSALSDDSTHDWYNLRGADNKTGTSGHNAATRAFSFRRGASKRFAEAWGISDKQFEEAAACREREEVARMWERHQPEFTSSGPPSRTAHLPIEGTPTHVQLGTRQNMQRGDIVDGEWHSILRAQGPSVTQTAHRQGDLRRAKTQCGVPTSMPGFHESFISQFQNNLRIEPQTRSSQSQGLHL